MRKLVITKSKIWTFLSLLTFKISLDLSYYFVISILYRYAKFYLRLNGIKLFEAYLLFLIIFVLISGLSRKKLSTIVFWALILLTYMPMLTIFALRDEPRAFMYAVTGFWIMVYFLMSHMPRITLRPIKQRKLIRYLIFIGLSVISLLIAYRSFGFWLNFSWGKIYGIRAEYVEAAIPSFAGYLFDWQGHIINPLLFAVFIVKKKWLYAVLIAIFQFYIFSIIGIRNLLFSIPFVLIFMWIATRKNPLALMATGLTAGVSSGILSYLLLNDRWVSSLLTRRTLLTPALTYFFYYDFFSEHGPLYLSSKRIFRAFVDYPYDLRPPYLIASVYYNRPEMGANTGIVGDAYMNFGFLGLILWGILFAVILKSADACSKGKDMRIAVAAIAMPMITITNSSLLTNLLTHGLLLALIMLYLLPKRTHKLILIGEL